MLDLVLMVEFMRLTALKFSTLTRGGRGVVTTLLHMHTHRKSPKVPIRRKDIKSETKCKNHNLRVICKMFGRVEIGDKVLIQYACTVK